MALSDRLIEQARHLATRDIFDRPRQDHLRRAVSAAYYALFHFLIDQSCRFLLGSSSENHTLRGVISRAFDHGAMRRASNSFASGALPQRLLPAMGGASVPAYVQQIANVFRKLQDERHNADYDLLLRFNRNDTLRLIDLAGQAMQIWQTVAPTPAGRLYLVALLAGERIREQMHQRSDGDSNFWLYRSAVIQSLPQPLPA